MRHWKPFVKKRIAACCFVIGLFSLVPSFGQNQLIFLHAGQGKLIRAKEGDQLSILYKGYLGQTEYVKNTLTQINDSTFLLGLPISSPGSSLLGKNVDGQLQCKEIRYQDVIAFRRSGLGRIFLKSGLTLGAAIGSILVLNKLYSENQISDFGKIGISLGVGLGMNLLINLSLPDKPNHHMKDGWQINPVKE